MEFVAKRLRFAISGHPTQQPQRPPQGQGGGQQTSSQGGSQPSHQGGSQQPPHQGGSQQGGSRPQQPSQGQGGGQQTSSHGGSQPSQQGGSDPHGRPQGQGSQSSSKPGNQQGMYEDSTAPDVHYSSNQEETNTDPEYPDVENPYDPNSVAISNWPIYFLPIPIDSLSAILQNALQNSPFNQFPGNCCSNQNSNSNTENLTQGGGQQQQTPPTRPSGGGQQSQTQPPARPSGGSQQSQSGSSSSSNTQPSSQGQTDPSTSGQMPSNGMVGYIPIVFFPCGGNGNGANGGGGMAMPYPYQQQQQQGGQQNPCAQCPGNSNSQQPQRSHPLFGAVSNARIFHNSDFNSVTQVFPRLIRSRKAKVDQRLEQPAIADSPA